MSPPRPLAATLRRIEQASGTLATQSTARMDEQLSWFRAMPPEQRSWITLVAQAGIASFVEWLKRSGNLAPPLEVFSTAPPEMARAVSLQQTVELVRLTVEVVESAVENLAAPGEEAALREAVLRYSREIAFAAAQVYAGVAETHGAWDARLEALVVDALLRGEPGESLPSQASALGWADVEDVVVTVGVAPPADSQTVLDTIHRVVHPSLAGVLGNRLLVVLGDAADPHAALAPLLPEFGAGPVVIGPTVPSLAQAARSATAALAGLRAVPGWSSAPRPVLAAELLPERALAGDLEARVELVTTVYAPLVEAGGPLLETATVFLEHGGALETTARSLYVHPNTVRYRLRRVAEVSGRSATDPRDAFALQVAFVLGRLPGQ